MNRRLIATGQEELRREIATGFPRLARPHRKGGCRAATLLAQYASEEAELLATALPKRIFGGDAGVPLTEAECRVVEDFHRRWLEGVVGSAPPGQRIDRRALERALLAALPEVAGDLDLEHSDRPRTLVFRTDVDGWTVDTLVDLSRPMRLWYAHLPRARDRRPVVMVSYGSWVGIPGAAEWTDYRTEDIPAVAADLADLCSAFLGRAPTVLAGLTPPESGF